MSNANLKLRVTFEFEIAAPAALAADDHATLCRKLGEILGPLALQGMPTVTAKQLAKVGANIISHHHHLDAESLVAPAIDRAVMVAAAPHLTDDELLKLAHQAGAKVAALPPAELKRLLRRQALAMVNEFRLVPCAIEGQLKFGGDITVGATLNLTNGGVTVNEEDRRNQLKQGTGVITLVAGDVRITGNCAGHTLSGPVIDVSIDDIAAARDELIHLWHAANV